MSVKLKIIGWLSQMIVEGHNESADTMKELQRLWLMELQLGKTLEELSLELEKESFKDPPEAREYLYRLQKTVKDALNE